MKGTKELKINKGITLIALVVTIIVMLILVGVTISVAINGGLFDQAGKAVGKTKNSINEEKNINIDSIIEKYVQNEDGEIAKLPEYSEELMDETTQVLKTNAKYISNNKIAIIPKGFRVSEVEGEKAIETGLVIKDANNNEFVWIPVANLNEFARATSGEDANGRTNYEGVLYNFEGTTATEMEYGVEYGKNTDKFKEPAILVGYDWDESLEHQESFNKMVESVAKYKGFYVGRYETSLNGNIAQSKSGEIPLCGITSDERICRLDYYVSIFFNICII